MKYFIILSALLFVLVSSAQNPFPYPPPPTCPEDSTKPSIAPDLSDCGRYYECINGEAVNKRCCQGCWYDPIKQVNCFCFNLKKIE